MRARRDLDRGRRSDRFQSLQDVAQVDDQGAADRPGAIGQQGEVEFVGEAFQIRANLADRCRITRTHRDSRAADKLTPGVAEACRPQRGRSLSEADRPRQAANLGDGLGKMAENRAEALGVAHALRGLEQLRTARPGDPG
jgi:hypothetical protein